ncbi:peroxiredoxin-like family protein [Saprospira grandis]|uniref:thioredoxin-dependent peroxiredoxin n=1 Tax=Saprospira grandis (strain Lewin) TaxID=984262 RepID=H6L5N5_SAPGL|nr:peroxiredoxin-like family protein [Saprospira grandis]AFC26285.1 alkyl hydroperoxide reductase/ Thiol specific antioxidant/ Mal allergen [Saprospira grandis str. Lewin]
MKSFQEKMAALQKKLEGRMPADYIQIMHKATADLRASGIQEGVLKVGDKFPAFTLKNQDGSPIQSVEIFKKGPVLFTFYRGIWCPYCNMDLGYLQQNKEKLAELGVQLFAISPELPDFLQKTKQQQKLDFDLLHDFKSELGQELGLRFSLPTELKALYADKFKIDLDKHQGHSDWTLPMPARFLVDQDGVIQYVETNPDYTTRPALDAVYALDSLKK